MTATFIWVAFAVITAVLIAVDVRRDGARQRREDAQAREDRAWAELVQLLEEGP